MRPTTTLPSILVLLSLTAAHCGGDGGSGPTRPPTIALATVEFVYQAPTATDPTVRDRFPGCVAGVGRTHFHPGWRGFNRSDMTADGPDLWRITFNDVPAGSEQRLRVSDPNTCATDPNGASTENVLANGVLLSRIVDTPGNGTEPGLAFTVSADGTISP